MFGFSSIMPKKSHQMIVGVILVAVFFSLGIFFNGEDSTITGRIVEDTLQEELSNNPALSNENDQNQEEITQESEEDYKVYEYYEYGGECSFDIKQAEDDVNDIISYLSKNDDEYQNIKTEYDQKLESLKNEYEPKLKYAREDYDQDQENLHEAQSRLSELQEVCSF